MKFIDRFLRDWRIKMVKPYVKPNDKVLDIGCYDETLFKSLSHKPLGNSIGLDPLLKQPLIEDRYVLLPGKFPNDLPEKRTFNCITMLAVLEHIPSTQQLQLSETCFNYLEANGRVIITVPSSFVDKILWLLSKLKLIDGMSLDEHYGFKSKDTLKLFSSKQFRLLKYKPFQLGLNNLYVFEKIA